MKKHLWYPVLIVCAVEIAVAVICQENRKAPAFTGILAVALGWLYFHLWVWRQYDHQISLALVSFAVIGLLAGINGHTSGGGLLLFTSILLWTIKEYREHNWPMGDLLKVCCWTLFILGVILEGPFHNQFFLPDGFRP